MTTTLMIVMIVMVMSTSQTNPPVVQRFGDERDDDSGDGREREEQGSEIHVVHLQPNTNKQTCYTMLKTNNFKM